MHRPWFSLIVPTRGRPEQLRRFLDSVANTAAHPERIEVVLVVDEDDPASLAVTHSRLNVKHAIGPTGRTMGELNSAGYAASTGDRVMLLNDDVIVRTRGWDATILDCLREMPDPFWLVHVNDTLIREHLCVFPLVSREFCELAGGICPREYQRYRIDDHIEDVFNLLAWVGERRTIYLPDVIFEHMNAVEHPTAGRVYESDPAILALDAPRFEALLPERKELVIRILGHISRDAPALRTRLEQVMDSFAVRVAGRQRVVRSAWSRVSEAAGRVAALFARGRDCVRRKGWGALASALRRRVA